MLVCLVHGYILFLKFRHMCDGLVKFDPHFFEASRDWVRATGSSLYFRYAGSGAEPDPHGDLCGPHGE